MVRSVSKESLRLREGLNQKGEISEETNSNHCIHFGFNCQYRRFSRSSHSPRYRHNPWPSCRHLASTPLGSRCRGRLLPSRAVDSALRQRLLQLGHTRLCYFGATQVKPFELLQLGKLLETRVGDLGVRQSKPFELLELGHFLEVRVGDWATE